MTEPKPRRKRDDFRQKTINALSRRVAYLCSNPSCRIPTVGPEQGGDGTVIVGVAAHITAAAPGGPRYDQSLTREQRRDQSNGIWLCQNHGKQVDADEKHFTVETLRAWKQAAESAAAEAITRLQAPRPPTVSKRARATLHVTRAVRPVGAHPRWLELTRRTVKEAGRDRYQIPPTRLSGNSHCREHAPASSRCPDIRSSRQNSWTFRKQTGGACQGTSGC